MSLNKSKISWCDYTWSPVVGCKHNCNFNGGRCYAESMNLRFKMVYDWNDPTFFPERMKDPYKLNFERNKGKRVFVCSMADLFGDWVSDEIITDVLKVAKECENLEFMFLTKNPKRYMDFVDKFSPNCWVGATACKGELKIVQAIDDVLHVNPQVKGFISYEPMLAAPEQHFCTFLQHMDLLIIGALSGPGSDKINKQLNLKTWTEHFQKIHRNVHIKENIKKYLI